MAVLVPTVSLGQLQASCGHSVVPCPCSSWLRWTGNYPHREAHPPTTPSYPRLTFRLPFAPGHGSQSIRRPPQIPALGFCQVSRRWGSRDTLVLFVPQSPTPHPQLSSLWPLGLVTGIPLMDPQELLLAQREPDRTWESSSHILLAK